MWRSYTRETMAKMTKEEVIDDITNSQSLGHMFAKNIHCLNEAVRNDKEIALLLVNLDGTCAEYLSQSMKDDFDVMMHAVGQNGLALKFASVRLRENKDIVLKACMNDGRSLEYASQLLKRDKEVVLYAIKESPCALLWADKELQRNKSFYSLIDSYFWSADSYFASYYDNNFWDCQALSTPRKIDGIFNLNSRLLGNLKVKSELYHKFIDVKVHKAKSLLIPQRPHSRSRGAKKCDKFIMEFNSIYAIGDTIEDVIELLEQKLWHLNIPVE